MFSLRRTTVAALLLATSSLFAQAPAPVSGAPKLTDTEQLKLENLRLKASLLQARQQIDQLTAQMAPREQQQLSTDFKSLMDSIQAEHPGFTFDPNTGELHAAPTPPAKK